MLTENSTIISLAEKRAELQPNSKSECSKRASGVVSVIGNSDLFQILCFVFRISNMLENGADDLMKGSKIGKGAYFREAPPDGQ